MSAKDWIGVGTGLTALVLSALTAYFNVFRQSDDLRVVISGTIKSVSLAGHSPNVSLVVDADYQIAFINAGSQPIDISQVGLISAHREKEAADGNDCPAGSFDLGYKSDAFVLKPGEIIRKDIRFSDDSKSSHGTIPLPSKLSDKEIFLVCLRFDFVTLDAVALGSSKGVMRITLVKSDPFLVKREPFWYSVNWEPLWSPTKPLVLLSRWHTVFSR